MVVLKAADQCHCWDGHPDHEKAHAADAEGELPMVRQVWLRHTESESVTQWLCLMQQISATVGLHTDHETTHAAGSEGQSFIGGFIYQTISAGTVKKPGLHVD